MDGMFASRSQNSHSEILTPNAMILGDGAFRRQLGHEGGAPMSGIGAHIRDTELALSLCFLPHKDTTHRWPSAKQEVGSRQTSNLSAP